MLSSVVVASIRIWSLLLLLLQPSLALTLFPADETTTTTTIRKLEDTEYFEYQLQDFQVRFEKCQFVKTYDINNNNNNPLATKQFIVFRLCDSCQDCQVYGTYTTTMVDYLQYTLQAQKNQLEGLCENCNEKCNDNGEYCSGCGKICYRYQNLENLGYVDAAEYVVECGEYEYNNQVYYVGPQCSSDDDTAITVGVFTDENCWEPLVASEDDDDDSAVVTAEEILGVKLSYHLFTYDTANNNNNNNDPVCLSCAETNENEDDMADADAVNEMCEELYAISAKCESQGGGFMNGFVNVNRQDENYENQVENEFMACTFIHSLLWDSYTESGEINYSDTQDVIVRVVTGPQKIVLGSLVVVFAGLLGAVWYLERKITEQAPPVGLVAKNDTALS